MIAWDKETLEKIYAEPQHEPCALLGFWLKGIGDGYADCYEPLIQKN